VILGDKIIYSNQKDPSQKYVAGEVIKEISKVIS
jgi:hypothetical protein